MNVMYIHIIGTGTGDRRQETGDRRQKTEDRRQKTGDRRQEGGYHHPSWIMALAA